MNKLAKTVVRAALFVVSMIVAVSAFGLLSAWVMSGLDPAQQEAIGAINTPWVLARGDRAFVPRSSNSPPLNPRTASSVHCADLRADPERSCTGVER